MLQTTHNSTQQATKYKKAAVRIANHLAKEAIWDGNRCNWIGHAVDNTNGSFQVVRRSFPADFYNGTAGIAFFLSKLLEVHQDPILEDLLEGTIEQILSQVKQGLGLESVFGFYGGQMGVAYTLKVIGQQCNRQEWESTGDQLLQQICQTEIKDFELDVIAGAAGGIPILLDLYHKSSDQKFLNKAIELGHFLVNKAEKHPTHWDWITPMSSQSLTGYSHGNAGIALALLELYAVSQQTAFYTGAMYGFHYERQTYNPTVQNWPDFREMGQAQTGATPTCGEAWCHGAPGIALTRLRAWQLTGDTSFKQEAEIALATTYKSVYHQLTQGKDTANYSLCHGMAGNADILLSGAQDLQVPVYLQVVQQVGDFGIEQYSKTGLTWPSGVHDPTGQTKGMGETPGFMLGLAGTGYFYLRLAHPDKMKSMLIL